MTDVRCAARRLVRAETKYDQRIIAAMVLACAWIGFWHVADRMDAGAAQHPHVTSIELRRVLER